MLSERQGGALRSVRRLHVCAGGGKRRTGCAHPLVECFLARGLSPPAGGVILVRRRRCLLVAWFRARGLRVLVGGELPSTQTARAALWRANLACRLYGSVGSRYRARRLNASVGSRYRAFGLCVLAPGVLFGSPAPLAAGRVRH